MCAAVTITTWQKLVICALKIMVFSLCVVKIYAYPFSLVVRVSTRRSLHYEEIRIDSSHHECRPDIADRLAHVLAHRCTTILCLQRAELRMVVTHCEPVRAPNDDYGALHQAHTVQRSMQRDGADEIFERHARERFGIAWYGSGWGGVSRPGDAVGRVGLQPRLRRHIAVHRVGEAGRHLGPRHHHHQLLV